MLQRHAQNLIPAHIQQSSRALRAQLNTHVWVKPALCNTHSALSNTPALRDLTWHIWGLWQQRICLRVCVYIHKSVQAWAFVTQFIKRIRVHAQIGQRESMIWACGLKCESVCDGEGDCFRQVLKCNRLRHVACSVSCCYCQCSALPSSVAVVAGNPVSPAGLLKKSTSKGNVSVPWLPLQNQTSRLLLLSTYIIPTANSCLPKLYKPLSKLMAWCLVHLCFLCSDAVGRYVYLQACVWPRILD